MFTFPVRVYYEDTDAAGVVYYANYLKFIERARTEYLAVFVVRRVEMDFLAPARLFDALHVTFELERASRAGMVARQSVLRAGETLARARVELACLDAARWKPARIPIDLASAAQPRPAP